MSKEHTYNRFGNSKYYLEPQPDPNDTRLTIQRIHKGSVKRLQVSPDTYAHAEPNGALYNGLREYKRTSFGEKKTPTYIFDQHNHALFGWYEVLKEGKIKRG